VSVPVFAGPLTGWRGSLIAAIRPPAGIGFGATLHPGIVYRVGGRIRGRRKLAISRAQETRTLTFVLVASLAPALVFMIGIAATLQQDLSDLSPIRSAEANTDLLKWSSLLREDHGEFGAQPYRTAVEVRALGYMMNGERVPREGDWVREFYLLPDAGHLFHPAHRDADQMIAVHLADGVRVRFSSRALVWAWGSLQSLPGDPDGPKPLYTLERAHAQPADAREIRRYYQ
jgi:hypothetical protein